MLVFFMSNLFINDLFGYDLFQEKYLLVISMIFIILNDLTSKQTLRIDTKISHADLLSRIENYTTTFFEYNHVFRGEL